MITNSTLYKCNWLYFAHLNQIYCYTFWLVIHKCMYLSMQHSDNQIFVSFHIERNMLVLIILFWFWTIRNFVRLIIKRKLSLWSNHFEFERKEKVSTLSGNFNRQWAGWPILPRPFTSLAAIGIPDCQGFPPFIRANAICRIDIYIQHIFWLYHTIVKYYNTLIKLEYSAVYAELNNGTDEFLLNTFFFRKFGIFLYLGKDMKPFSFLPIVLLAFFLRICKNTLKNRKIK